MTVDDIIRRMQEGEPLRWITKSAMDRHRPGAIDCRELWIGNTLVIPDSLVVGIMDEVGRRIIELPYDRHDTYIDYELK